MRTVIMLALMVAGALPAPADAQATSGQQSASPQPSASKPTPGPAAAGPGATANTPQPGAATNESKAAPAARPSLADAPLGENEELVAVMAVTQGQQALGSIVVRLHSKFAPAHVKNFVKLAESGFYDGTLFHRTSPESFVQGGDPLSRDADPKNDGYGGPGYTLAPEANDKPCERGAVVAAQTGKADSGSQFFICLKDHPEWNGTFTVFGSVIGGLEIADRIGGAPRKGEHPVDAFSIQVTVEKRIRKLKIY